MFMDTIVSISIIGTNYQNSNKIIKRTMTYMKNLSKELDVYNTNNIMHKINKQGYHKTLKLSPHVNAVLKEGLFFSKISLGYFDITIYPLTKLWNFRNKIIPPKQKIIQTIKYVDYKNVILTNQTIHFLSPNTNNLML